jgi:hypothetical protein
MEISTLADLYYWSLFATGLGICLWAGIKKGKRSYLIIGVFFLSPLFGLIMNELSYQLNKEELNLIAESKQQELDAMIANGEPFLIENEINIPFFETFLIAGLFLTARHEPKGEIQSR